jgi:hypothetical protein
MPFEAVEIQSFAPDLRPDTPSIVVDSNWMYPTVKGYRTLNSLALDMPAPGGGWVYGAYLARYLDGSSRIFAGTNTTIEEADIAAQTWGDVSRTTPAYNVSTNGRWRFAQFGNDTIAVNGTDVPQFINESGTQFAVLAGPPPVAKYIATAQNFVVLANLSGGGVDENWWWCSSQGDDADWAPDAATQSANGFVKDTPGPITGLHAIGRNLVIYKARAMYLMRYVGPPFVWSVDLLSQTAGAMGNESVVDIGGTHVFMGFSDFYIYDGSGPPKTLPNNMREFMFERGDLDKSHAYATVGRWDRELDVVFWHYPSNDVDQASDDNVILDKWVAWNIGTERWSYGRLNVSAAILPEFGTELGLTYATYGATYTNWNSADQVAWSSSIFSGGPGAIQGVFSSDDNKLYSFTGPTDEDAYLTLGKRGDGTKYSLIRKVRPILSRYPSAATKASCEIYATENLGSVEVQADARDINIESGWFDVRADGRYIHPKFTFTDDVEIVGYVYDFEERTGER